MPRISEVVKHLILINIVFFIGSFLILGDTANIDGATWNQLISGQGDLMDWKRNLLGLFYPASPYFQPFQLVTHMFMHGNFMHILFNMFGIFMFGTAVEYYLGPKKFLAFYLISGFGAMLLHWLIMYLQFQYGDVNPFLVNVPMMGASGALFGILVAFAMFFPNTPLMLIFLPIPIKAKYFVAIYAAMELFLGLGNFQSGVAHFAHLGGALAGFLLILYWKSKGQIGR